MKRTVWMIATAAALGVAQSAWAHGDHEAMQGGQMHEDHHSHDMGEMKGGFLVKKEIDGYQVSFHIMKAPAEMAKGGSHHLMIKIEKEGKVLNDLMVNSKAIHPNGESESKMLMRMGDWYMAAYDFGHEGQHQVMVLFKDRAGNKHFGGIYYPEKR